MKIDEEYVKDRTEEVMSLLASGSLVAVSTVNGESYLLDTDEADGLEGIMESEYQGPGVFFDVFGQRLVIHPMRVASLHTVAPQARIVSNTVSAILGRTTAMPDSIADWATETYIQDGTEGGE